MKAAIITQASGNDLKNIKTAHSIAKTKPEMGQALLRSLLRHTWYLNEDVVVVALADPDLDDDDKVLIVKELIKHEYPEIRSFIPKKTEISCDMEIDRNTKLRHFIGKKSWFLRYF